VRVRVRVDEAKRSVKQALDGSVTRFFRITFFGFRGVED